MKVEDISKSLGIGDIVSKDNCIFLKSKKDLYEKLRYNEELLIYFNSIQGGNYITAMRNHKYIYSFLSRGSEMVFYELYEVEEETTIKDAVNRELFPLNRYRDNIENIDETSSNPYFKIKKLKTPGELEKKLVVKSIPNRATKIGYKKFSQYEVLAIEKLKKATNFNSYNEVYLNYNELEQVVKDATWQDMLSRFGGVYLIHDKNTGKNYVGSAYNIEEGILGRWKDYVKNPTGKSNEEGNKKLVELLNKKMHGNNTNLTGKEYAKKYFMYSILEVLPLGNANRIIEAENRWKMHLGTREAGYGLNDN